MLAPLRGGEEEYYACAREADTNTAHSILLLRVGELCAGLFFESIQMLRWAKDIQDKGRIWMSNRSKEDDGKRDSGFTMEEERSSRKGAVV